MKIREVIQAALTFVDGRLVRGMKVAISEDGLIADVGEEIAHPVTCQLDRSVLLPGFVNAHSHAFQRGLRGRGETLPGGAGSFWTWREEMYALVEQMTPDLMYALAVQAFAEMRSAGITTVGEFHYLHHCAGSEQFELDDAVISAAHDAQIRLVLLQTFYRTGGIGRPLAGGQRQFNTPDVTAYWRQFDRLAERLHVKTQSQGVVAHSIRAADIEDIAALHAEAQRRGLVFHMHVEEQPAEIDACTAHYSMRPMALLLERLEIDERFTAVHCTHTTDDDLSRFSAAGGNICICPLTEANLGDGLPRLSSMRAGQRHLCLGSDSNARISMVEEMRWLEYGQRLATESRGVIRKGERWDAVVLDAGTEGGARSLGLEAGSIRPGRLADFAIVDLDHPSLQHATDETLLAAFLTGGENSAVAVTIIGGDVRGFGLGRTRPK